MLCTDCLIFSFITDELEQTLLKFTCIVLKETTRRQLPVPFPKKHKIQLAEGLQSPVIREIIVLAVSMYTVTARFNTMTRISNSSAN